MHRRGETAHQHLTSALRKNHMTNCPHSVDHLLKLLHRQGAHSLRRWLGLEHAWFLSEGVDALASCSSWLLLQFHIQRASELELTGLLQLRSCKSNYGLGHLLDLTRLEASLLSDGGVRASGGHLAAALHRLALHGSWSLLHWKGHC